MKGPATWQDVRKIADELELQVHLGGMDARDRWCALQLRLGKVEQTLEHSGERAGEAVAHELAEIHDGLVHLRDDIFARARGDYATGW